MLGAILGAVGGIASSIFGNKAAKKQNKAAAKAAAAANASQEAIAQRNIELQREFAQKGIQWKVEDAISAGIHPLAALGAQTTSFAPVSVGTTVPQITGSSVPDLGAMGQNIGNAIDATQSKPTRLATVLGTLAVQRGSLENELLASQVAASKLALARGNPPFPDPNNPSPSVDIKASPQEAGAEGHVSAIPEAYQWYRLPGDRYTKVPAQQYKQAIEDNMFYEGQDVVRTRLLPNWSSDPIHRPPWAPPKGKTWVYHGTTGDWTAEPFKTQSSNPRASNYRR